MKISVSDGIEFFSIAEPETLQQFAEIALEYNFSQGIFKNEKRNIANFERTDCIVMDVDNDGTENATLTIEEAKNAFGPFRHIILTSRSHQIEKSGQCADRFRVVLFLDTPIVRAEDYYATWYWVKDQFPAIDHKCKDPSRFWFKHKAIYSINEEGRLVTPIRYTEPEKPKKDGREALSGERGDLSKATLQFLAFGPQVGGRNDATYRAAKEFQQNLYTYQDAHTRILAALKLNDVIGGDFTEYEATIAVRSAYSKDAKHAARLEEVEKRAFNYISAKELLDEPDTQDDWLIKDLLLVGGTSLIGGAPKIGKSTLIRQAAICVARGEPFLGQPTKQGTVIHYSMDEKKKSVKRQYRTQGLTHEDPVILSFGNPKMRDYMKHLEEDIVRLKPVMVIADTLAGMTQVKDMNNYGELVSVLGAFNDIVERTGTHILFIHHANKPNQFSKKGSGDSILGSTGISGTVDTFLIFEQGDDSHARILTVKGRDVDDSAFDKTSLAFDRQTKCYAKGGITRPRLSNDDFF